MSLYVVEKLLGKEQALKTAQLIENINGNIIKI